MEVCLPSKQIGMILNLMDPKNQDSISFQAFEAVLLRNDGLLEDSIASSAMTASVSAPMLTSEHSQKELLSPDSAQ